LFEDVKAPAGQDVFNVERSARRYRLDDEKTRRALAGLFDELVMERWSGPQVVMQKVKRDCLRRPSGRQLIFGRFRREREHEEGIECRPELFGAINVIGDVIPQEEFVPCLVEKLLTKLLDSVREERGHENAFR